MKMNSRRRMCPSKATLWEEEPNTLSGAVRCFEGLLWVQAVWKRFSYPTLQQPGATDLEVTG